MPNSIRQGQRCRIDHNLPLAKCRCYRQQIEKESIEKRHADAAEPAKHKAQTHEAGALVVISGQLRNQRRVWHFKRGQENANETAIKTRKPNMEFWDCKANSGGFHINA